ncbi:MAG: hypothetical protein MUF52_07015 [Syntrophobacteraceae bacterium]|jgi:GGDEF domain-containing protein|nr:hypothetical protein [Syntrophobacteraceae bacterium]
MESSPFQSLVSLLSNILEAYTTAFFVLEPKSRQLQMTASQTLSKYLPEKVALPLEQSGILSQVQKVGQVVHLDKLQEGTLNLSATIPFYRDGESHIKGVLVVPVGDGAGVLYVDTKFSWGFNDKQQKLIREVANVLHYLLERELSVSRQESYGRVFDLWQKLDALPFKDDAVEEYCGGFINACSGFLGSEYGFLSLRQPGRADQHVIAATSNVPRSLVSQSLPANQGLMGYALENRKSLLIGRLNPGTSDHYLFLPSEGLPHQGTFWALPSDMALGHTLVLAFLSRQPREWSPEEQFGITHALEQLRMKLERCCYQEECQQLRHFDVSTGLLNAMAFESQVDATLTNSMHNSLPCTVALLQFEPWQILSTKVSPRQLRRWQNELAANIREGLPREVTVGLMGENRFGLLFPGLTVQEARTYLTAAADSGRKFMGSRVKGVRLQAQAGAVGFPQEGTRSEELWPLVSARLYAALRTKSEKTSV